MKTNINSIIVILIASLLAVMPVSAYDAPSMWMVHDVDDHLNLMVNTSDNSSGANAWIHFDPRCMNITGIDFTGSPWTPMTGTGWSHQYDHVIMSLTNFDGVAPGEYQIARMEVDCIADDCTSNIEITHAEPLGVVTHNLSYTCDTPDPITSATIAIGDGVGTTSLPITVSDADGVGSCDVTLYFDPTIVTVTGISAGAMDCTFTNLEHVDEGWIRIGAHQGDNAGLMGEFTLVTVDLAPVGTNQKCSLNMSVTTFKDSTPTGNPMNYTVSNGTYTSSKNGDVDGNDIVDIADSAYLSKHVIGIAGYELIDISVADVDGNGIIDVADASYLAKHVIGIEGFEVLR